MTIRIEMPMPDDWHVHLRDGILMERVTEFSGHQYLNNLVMPNLTPPLTSARAIEEYYSKLIGHSRSLDKVGTRMTLYLTPKTTAEDILIARPLVLAAKYYPQGGTTNSNNGLASPRDLQPGVLEAMQNVDMILCLHAELAPVDEPDLLKREHGFITHLEWLVENFPQLRIVVEHVSDLRMLRKIMGMPENVAATITAHHPFVTYWEAQRDPHCMCMPVAKTPSDREYLARMILRANDHPKIFFGSDSAPHTLANKLAGKFGAWTSPVAIPVLWQHFDSRGGSDKWDNFVAFMCANGANFYGVGPTLERRPSMTLKRERWQVPEVWPIGDHSKVDMTDPTQVLVPWKAGEVLDWRVEGMEWFGEVYED